jgi:hypothetical protein
MLRKTALALTAVAAMGAAALSPTAASAKSILSLHIGIGGPWHGGYYPAPWHGGYYPAFHGYDCYYKVKKIFIPGEGPVFKKVKVCY